VRGLELNDRQQAEANPVFALVRERLGGIGVRMEAALRVVADDRFEPEPLIALLGGWPQDRQRELLDAIEHLHTILIPEQREQLRKELQRR
jgi:hypothetical protein